MPTYEFQLVGGKEIVKQFLPISQAPDVGSIRTIKGKKYMRIISVPTLNSEQIRSVVEGYPHVDYTLPKGDLGHGTDRSGRPIIKSQHHERELIRQSEGRMRRD